MLILTGYRPGSKENCPQDANPSGRGIANLRVGHIRAMRIEGDSHKLHIDFIGKHEVRYNKILSIDEKVYRLLKIYRENNQTLYPVVEPTRKLFNFVEYSDVEAWLKKFHLQPKDIRTYRASDLFEKELKNATNLENIKTIYNEVRMKVRDLLCHGDLRTLHRYIDPRIVFAW